MFYNNYRFYLSDALQFTDLEQSNEQIKRILQEATDLQLIRVAINLSDEKKSISILCAGEKNAAIKDKVTGLLLQEGFTVSEEIEEEQLECDDELHHEHCQELHHGHNHAHHHGHSHAHHHGHSHAHHHGHSHKSADKQNHGHSHEAHDEHGHGHHHGHSHDNHWFKAGLGLAWGIGLLVLSLGSFGIPFFAYLIITGLTTLMTLYLGRTVYQSAWRALREKKWDMTTLYTISTLTIVVVSLLSLFIPGLPMMFEAAPFVLGFWHLGEGIEHSLVDTIYTELDVRDCVKPLARLKGSPDKEVSIKTLIPNDTIIVAQGEVIPVDGVLTTSALLYTTRIDGSPHSKKFYPGDKVEAGMSLAASDDPNLSLEMRVSKTYQNSYLSIIAQNIKKANDEKAPVEEFANTILKYFIPGLLGIALVSGLVIGFLFTPALALQCVISVLVSACPCALSLITPTAVKIGMKKAADQGVQFKNGKVLQAAADINTVVFDLNGTLTQGKVSVSSLTIADTDKHFLRHIALLEKASEHSVAQAIKSYINKENITASEDLVIKDFDDTHHSGVKGIINGELFMVGTQKMLADNGITQIDSPYDDPQKGSVYIVRGTRVIGQIDVVDSLRTDAKKTIVELQRQGIGVHICTGADKVTAEKYAVLLGVPKRNICANAIGVEKESDQNSKTNYIKKLQALGYKVAMVGDAANDLTAIAHANLGIGIATKSTIGNEITQQKAGMVLLTGLLFPIVTAFDVAAKTKKNIFQNLLVSLTYNSTITLIAAGLLIALGFALNPVLGVALMVLESTIVLANLYRFKHQSVVVAEPDATVATSDAAHTETTTSKMLHALDHRAQHQEKSTNVQEPERGNSKSGAFFASMSPTYRTTQNSTNEMAPNC